MTLRRLLELDAGLTKRLRLEPGQKGLWAFTAFLAHSGDSWFWALGLVLVWLATTGEWRYRAVVLAVGVVALALMVFAIKFSIKRRRPEGEWGAIYRKTDPHSFPSGHAARAIMLATAVCGLGPLWLAVVLLVWAPLVCLARVGMGLHYISDVLAGGVLGVAAGLVLLAAAPWITQTFLFLLG
jgi:undecaprenyl-diphosphatase